MSIVDKELERITESGSWLDGGQGTERLIALARDLEAHCEALYNSIAPGREANMLNAIAAYDKFQKERTR